MDQQVEFERIPVQEDYLKRDPGLSCLKDDNVLRNSKWEVINNSMKWNPTVIPLSVEDYKNKVADILQEFFSSFDYVEASQAILELGNDELRAEVVKKCVSMAMDRRDKEREASSQLLYFMKGRVLKKHHMSEGFITLLSSVDDLAVDVPHVKLMLSQFLARAVNDTLLEPYFISKSLCYFCKTKNPEDQSQREILRFALKLCYPGQGLSFQLNDVWGLGDGRSVERMKDSINTILQEYLVTGDQVIATKRIIEVDAPHFYHEVVRRAIQFGLDRCYESRKQLWNLIHSLNIANVISSQQIASGFRHLFNTLDDLSLDTPQAEKLLFEALAWAKEDKCLDNSDLFNLMV